MHCSAAVVAVVVVAGNLGTAVWACNIVIIGWNRN
jgi:hypothetical protein